MIAGEAILIKCFKLLFESSLDDDVDDDDDVCGYWGRDLAKT